MTRARPFLLLPLLAVTVLALAVAACATERKPIRGFDEPPAGTIVLDADPGGTVMMWPIFDLPAETQTFRPRLDGRDLVTVTSGQDLDQRFYDYFDWRMQGWTGGWNSWLDGVVPGTHVVELVDSSGRSWGRSAPLLIPAGGPRYAPTGQNPAVVFVHFDDQIASWNIDPTTQDGDMATDEITVTNLLGEDAVVERCMIANDVRTSCTPFATVAPQADLRTVETMVASSSADYAALFIHLASDASQSYQRDLVQGSDSFTFGSTCQVERILVHGTRPNSLYSPAGTPTLAMSSCYGYRSGPPSP